AAPKCIHRCCSWVIDIRSPRSWYQRRLRTIQSHNAHEMERVTIWYRWHQLYGQTVRTLLMRQRSLAAIWQKARRGEFQCRIPVGFCWTEDGRIELDPDRRVQQAVRHVFDKFAELGSAHQVFLSFREEGIQVPYARFERSEDSGEWKPPVYRSLHAVLENPVYAGAYV